MPVRAAVPVDRADIDDAAEAARVHALPHRLRHVEAGAEIGVDHGVPHVARQLAHGRITCDAGVVHQHFDRTEILLDLGDDRLADGEIADVELVDGDAGLGLLVAAQSAAWLLLSLPAGAWVDRMPRRTLLIVALGLGLAASIFAVAAAAAGIVSLLGVAAFVGASGTVVYVLTSVSLLPR